MATEIIVANFKTTPLNMYGLYMYKVSALACTHIHNLDKNFRKGGSECILPQSCRKKMWEGCVSYMQSAKSL